MRYSNKSCFPFCIVERPLKIMVKTRVPLLNKNKEIQILNRSTSFFVLLVLLFSVLFGWQSWSRTKADEINRLSTVMELGEKSLDKYFFLLEMSMRGLSRDMHTNNPSIEAGRARTILTDFLALHPDLLSALLVGTDGQIVASSAVNEGQPLPSIKSSQSFETSKEAILSGMNFSVGRPVLGTTTKRWLLPLRQSVRDKSGELH